MGMTPKHRLHKYLREGVPRDIAKECVQLDIEAIRSITDADYVPQHNREYRSHGLGERSQEGEESDEGPVTWEDLGYESDGGAGDSGGQSGDS